MNHRYFILLIMGLFLLESCGSKPMHALLTNKERIENDLRVITKTNGFRNYENLEVLNFVADYIFSELNLACDTVYYQTYEVDGYEYKNVIGKIGIENTKKIVVGAHYDVCGDQEGADDNASGVVGLIELARLISNDSPHHHQIEFVAYTLEEPPYFGSEQMGSFVHAASLYDNKEQIEGMICLEMIGYFNMAKKSQDYPIKILKLFYGGKGDYITVVQKFGNGKFGRQVKRNMKKLNRVKTKSFKGPSTLPGVDFSDHMNYWKHDFSAVMITNTAFYRNKNYHLTSDRIETLDIEKMSLVIDEVYLSLKQICKSADKR